MKRFAFTMLELVFVIVVIGIITAVMLPRIDRDNVYEAAQQLISHIKYTQHLAMIDNVYDDADTNWYLHRWKIDLSEFNLGNDVSYIISKDTDNIFQGHATIANDPLSRLPMDGRNNDEYNLEQKYNIGTLTYDVSGKEIISFDSLGRPYGHFIGAAPTTPQDGLLTNAYELILVSGDSNATITIQPETGYTSLTDIN